MWSFKKFEYYIVIPNIIDVWKNNYYRNEIADHKINNIHFIDVKKYV